MVEDLPVEPGADQPADRARAGAGLAADADVAEPRDGARPRRGPPRVVRLARRTPRDGAGPGAEPPARFRRAGGRRRPGRRHPRHPPAVPLFNHLWRTLVRKKGGPGPVGFRRVSLTSRNARNNLHKSPRFPQVSSPPGVQETCRLHRKRAGTTFALLPGRRIASIDRDHRTLELEGEGIR